MVNSFCLFYNQSEKENIYILFCLSHDHSCLQPKTDILKPTAQFILMKEKSITDLISSTFMKMFI